MKGKSSSKVLIFQVRLLVAIVIAIVLQGFLTFGTAFAETEKKYELAHTSFEVLYEDLFDLNSNYKVHGFPFDEQSLGELSLTGGIENVLSYTSQTAYTASGPLEIHYTYDGSLHSGIPEDWNICFADTKSIGRIQLPEKIGQGALIIQKSSDGENWEFAAEATTNFLTKEKDNLIVYEINDSERFAGTFFRIILAYEIKARIKKNADITIPKIDIPIDVPLVNSDDYDYRCCSQVYEFYVCSSENPVILKDVISGTDVSAYKAVQKGFQIDKRASGADVKVTYNGEIIRDVQSYDAFYQAGEYRIEVETPVGAKYQYELMIDEGLNLKPITPVVYENTKKKGYSKTGMVEGRCSTGVTSYSVLKLGYSSRHTCTEGMYFDTPAYGVTGDSVSFFLNLNQKQKMKENGWIISPDSWGKSKSEKIYGASTGRIDTGAVLVQTSSDGKDWVNQEKLGYADGLFNTDFENNYGDNRDVLIYTPEGTDVINGIYVRIAYAYMARNLENGQEKRFIERYLFFLCSNELGAVTIHNLTVQARAGEVLVNADDSMAEVYVRTEDMLPGSATVTGFTIDKRLNPVAQYSIAKDGQPLNIIGGEKFTETGRYDITVQNFFGTKEVLPVYVDRLSNKEAYKLYFGDSLLSGKRIFSEGKVPVYEGSQAFYHLNEVSDSYLPIGGTFTNQTTGETITLSATREEREGVLFTPGSYEAVFTNNPFSATEEQSGDYRIFTFHFEIIESGKAPGPVVNQKNLRSFNAQNISGCNPHAYALTYQSAAKGNITLVFATEKAAYEYALRYESGIVERQKDGSYRYTGSFLVNQKQEYNSNWDVNDAIEYFARLAVHDWYFDLSDDQ